MQSNVTITVSGVSSMFNPMPARYSLLKLKLGGMESLRI
jgi:hypothetical protein